jgi:hypothetical protein
VGYSMSLAEGFLLWWYLGEIEHEEDDKDEQGG